MAIRMYISGAILLMPWLNWTTHWQLSRFSSQY
ncbi:MAG: hypothetical protein D4S01_04340 [Dehalococcoidia bacterium]|nr:MAG: hypothetical protein D4S01_04340 [Dehalococcoidia bacterium]